MKCFYLDGCPFYNDKMPIDSGLGGIYKKKYCLGDNETCARYMVCQSLGQKYVPKSLYPSMVVLAQQIIDCGEIDCDYVESSRRMAR